MSPRTINLTETLYDYVLANSLREPPLLARLREETAALPMSKMQIGPDQGQLMRLLVELIGAQRAVEVGTFTGYSSLSVALALPADGKLVACDISEEYTAIARRYWAEAGIAERIDLRLGPALETLDGLIADGGTGAYDFAFIDADKTNYDGYYERCLTLLRPGGLMAIDNVLWSGAVTDAADRTPDTLAIRALNAKVHKDERVSISLVTVGDGLMLARKR
jgi:predicted O-methyltransferase YrrM